MRFLTMSEMAMCLMVLSVLFPISYLNVFRKKQWISDLDEDELRNLPESEHSGHIEIKYTFIGAIMKSIGFAGIIDAVLLLTSPIWSGIIEIMTLGTI